MLCPQGHPLPVPDFTAQFCPTCGSALINPCPVGHDNVANARYCRDCGRSMGLPSGTPTRSTLAVVPPTTAVLRAAPPAVADPWLGDPPTGTPPPVAPPDDSDDPGRRHHGTGLLIAIGVIAVAVVGVVVALFVTSSPDATPGAGSVDTAPATATSAPGTTVPATSPTSTTLSTQALPQAQALTALLSQSSGSRSQVGTATAAIASCSGLAGAQATLASAQASRQALLSQLGQLDLSALPQSTGVRNALTDAWQSSASSDGSYAQWAADEQAKTCVPNDSTDAGYQAALVADGHASAAKARFTSLWNPIATSLGLQTWQPNQI